MKVLLIILLLFSTFTVFSINLNDAIIQKLVVVQTKGLGGHQGEVIQLDIKNITGKSINIEISPGLFLLPVDSSEQRMMIAQEIPFALASYSTKSLKVNAFCTQLHKSSPSTNALFKIGIMATGNLLELSKIISKNKFFSDAAQAAIWCITDKCDLYTIVSNNSQEFTLLRQFVSKATGQPLDMQLTKNTEVSNQPKRLHIEQVVKDTIRFSNREDGKSSLILYDAQGKELLVFFRDRPMKKGSNVRYSYSLTYVDLVEGDYFIRLRKDEVIVYEKKFVIKVE